LAAESVRSHGSAAQEVTVAARDGVDGQDGAREVPIDGVLDLHTFQAREVPDLVREYIALCRERRIYDVRIIHGKGRGVLRHTVRAVLQRIPGVASCTDADSDAGGWGATCVRLRE
jgi:DNA-nicking Smr family endonuclease